MDIACVHGKPIVSIDIVLGNGLGMLAFWMILLLLDAMNRRLHDAAKQPENFRIGLAAACATAVAALVVAMYRDWCLL